MGNSLLGQASLSTYQPNFREKASDWLRGLLFSDDREGQRKAERLLGVAELNPAIGAPLALYDAGRAAGQGDYIGAGLNMAVVPFAVAAKTPIKRAAMELDNNLTRAVASTKGARLTDEGLALRVQRNQTPDQEGAESVRGGVFYLPEGAEQSKYYSTGKNGYGGKQAISGETLFKNPLFTKGATGGKAPETAYDALNGKGAYQAMRDEALKSYGWGVAPGQKIERVYAFLEKHAPEMANLAEYIVGNSSQGNQLAYALQEAAVASAARRAGHDGILGYSTSRKTKEPFISEVFDVRENRYPSPSGDYSMWPEFEPLLGR